MRRWGERGATALIIGGVVMLVQPVSITLYGYSFVTTLAGVVLSIIAPRLPE